jgi:hypothetical protein
MNRNTTRGIAIAGAVCALLAAGTAQAKEKAAKQKQTTQMVRCGGANACKGHGACAGAENACKGQNACKGHGFTEEKSAKACEDKGGKVLASTR